MASLAGAWTVLVYGFGTMRVRDGRLWVAPRLPQGLSRLGFNVWYRRRNICVVATPGEARYHLEEGEPFEILHYGEPVLVTSDEVTRPLPSLPRRPRPSQPPGREPARRRPPG
jgi:alpha,alpha-trehalose phosphorylase